MVISSISLSLSLPYGSPVLLPSSREEMVGVIAFFTNPAEITRLLSVKLVGPHRNDTFLSVYTGSALLQTVCIICGTHFFAPVLVLETSMGIPSGEEYPRETGNQISR